MHRPNAPAKQPQDRATTNNRCWPPPVTQELLFSAPLFAFIMHCAHPCAKLNKVEVRIGLTTEACLSEWHGTGVLVWSVA